MATAKQHRPEWDILLIACQKGDADLVTKFLDVDGMDPNHANAIQQSALHVAAWWARDTCIQILLDHGANVHAQNTMTGATPLHCVMQSAKAALDKNRRLESIRLLLSHGSDPKAMDFSGRTPLEYVQNDEEDADREAIVQIFQNPTPISQAIARRDLEAFQQFLISDIPQETNSNDTDPPTLPRQETTTLSKALVAFTTSWCNYGLDLADQDTTDAELAKVTESAQFYQQAFQILSQSKLTPNNTTTTTNSKDELVAILSATNESYETSMDILCGAIVQRYKRYKTMQDEWIMAWSLAGDCIVTAAKGVIHYNKDMKLYTSKATAEYWLDIARRNYMDLAERWKSWQIPYYGIMNRQNMTPLHFAARSGHVDMVHFLLKDDTANGNDNIAILLQQLISQLDSRGQTALQAAVTNGHTEVAKLLAEQEAAGGPINK